MSTALESPLIMVPVTDPKRVDAARKRFGLSEREIAKRKAEGLRTLKEARAKKLVRS